MEDGATYGGDLFAAFEGLDELNQVSCSALCGDVNNDESTNVQDVSGLYRLECRIHMTMMMMGLRSASLAEKCRLSALPTSSWDSQRKSTAFLRAEMCSQTTCSTYRISSQSRSLWWEFWTLLERARHDPVSRRLVLTKPTPESGTRGRKQISDAQAGQPIFFLPLSLLYYKRKQTIVKSHSALPIRGSHVGPNQHYPNLLRPKLSVRSPVPTPFCPILGDQTVMPRSYAPLCFQGESGLQTTHTHTHTL